ncbi:MAG TPA: hypothetical protein VK702_10765 [Candidatus Acidoferrum sp.]|nr:hypothetical protein [Candidatus Acidoferrum sp.]
MRRLATFLICACAFALAGCGSATDAVTFKPPANYASAAQIGPFMQLWRGPQHSSMMLMAFPTKIDLDKAMTGSNFKDAQVLKQSSLQICGNQPAYYVSMIGTGDSLGSSSPGIRLEKHQVDLIATDAGGKTYMAMYVRPIGSPADATAESAIRNVCSKP